MSEIRPWTQAKLTDRPVAVIAVLGDLLVCAVVLLMSIGVIGHDPATRAEETSAWQSAGKLYAGWLVVGAVSFAVLRMPRALLAHVSTMVLAPVVLIGLVLLPGLGG
ncbi:hypothetical protein ACN2WE_06690 [Streptomyces sp. cg28]|uniref:hypothetical protein n=1 Tax=Streptomyces sp. cg28 TaxID=3403457 RepID=UPI003B20E00C